MPNRCVSGTPCDTVPYFVLVLQGGDWRQNRSRCRRSYQIELGPTGKPAKRWAHFKLNSSPDGLAFLPFEAISLYIDQPQEVEVRVLENDIVIGSKTLPFLLSAPE
jgi:hypothetical protein